MTTTKAFANALDEKLKQFPQYLYTGIGGNDAYGRLTFYVYVKHNSKRIIEDEIAKLVDLDWADNGVVVREIGVVRPL